jgi:hypothetical protein
VTGRLVKYALVFSIASFFAVMWGLLLRAHVPTPVAAPVRPDYDNLLKLDEEERFTRWGIYLGPKRVGRADMTVARLQDGTVSVRAVSELKLDTASRLLFGLSGKLDVLFGATVSPLRGLLAFNMKSKLLKSDLQGSVRGGEILLTGHVGDQRVRTSLPYDEDKLLGEAFSPLTSLPELKKSQVGQRWTMSMLNPITGALEDVTATVRSYKDIDLAGDDVRVFELSFSARTNHWSSWVTEDGEILVQGTPFGLTLRREDLPRQAIASLSLAGQPAPASNP